MLESCQGYTGEGEAFPTGVSTNGFVLLPFGNHSGGAAHVHRKSTHMVWGIVSFEHCIGVLGT